MAMERRRDGQISEGRRMIWNKLSRQFRQDGFALLFILVAGPLIGLGMGYAAKTFGPAISATIQ